MLEKIRYVNSVGEIIKFGENGIYVNENDLRDYVWNYDTKSRKIENFRKEVTAKKLEIIIFAETEEKAIETKNRIFETFEKDIIANSQGKIYIGDYYDEVFIVESKKNAYLANKKELKISIKIISGAGTWIKDELYKFRYAEQGKDTSGHGYPYGYEYDYTAGIGYTSSISCSAIENSNFILTIYGYASDPEIAIGDNVYRLNYTIQDGEHAVIDSREKKITLVKTNGIGVNLFRYKDKEHYMFEKIKTGEQKVYWNGKYDFDMLLRSERSEPPWT